MAVFAVTYTYTSDSDGRDRHRPAHRDFLGELAERGVNLCSGPFGADEEPGALLLLAAGSKEEAIGYTDDDPFRIHGLVADVAAREWIPVLGELAEKFR